MTTGRLGHLEESASTRWTSEQEEVPAQGGPSHPAHPIPSHRIPSAGGSVHGEPRHGAAARARRVFFAAFARAARATNTCGSPPEDFCLQMGARDATKLCHRCDAADPRLHHNASLLTDFHSEEESTWWQSQSMAFGIQHPNSVNITLHLGKAYEITYVRLKFHTSRPESFAIYKRSRAEGPWLPFQYYSASCERTYGQRPRQPPRPGEDERVAFCSDEFSDISPLSGGNVAFSTLEGRPSAYNFDSSPALQEWVTVTDLLISLNRLNTFGDDIFKDPKVLQSYYYAISDFSVGGSLHLQCDSSGACACKATVTGWKCERCKDGFHSLGQGGCRACACNPAGSVGTCDPNSGRCVCKEHVEGATCDRCRPGWFNLQPHNPVGCSSCFCYGHSTACTVAAGYEETQLRATFERGPEGWAAATPGGTAIPLHWAAGEVFAEWDGEDPVDFLAPAKFLQNQRLSYGQLLSLQLGAQGNGSAGPLPLPRARLELEAEDVAVALQATLSPGSSDSESPRGRGKQVVTFRLHEAEEGAEPSLSPFSFQRLLSNLTSLRLRVSRGPLQVGRCALPLAGHCRCLHHTEGPSCERCSAGFYGNPFAGREDDCQPCPCPGGSPCAQVPGSGDVVCTGCPPGQRGRRCELCDDGFFGDPLGQRGPVRPCSPCQCHGNVDANAVGNCDPVSGRCLRCLYNTTGEHCERCQRGFYGAALAAAAGKCLSERVEAAAGRALQVSNGSSELLRSLLEGSAALQSRRELEARYQDIERAQGELSAAMLEVAAEANRTYMAVHQANADMAKKLLPVTMLEPPRRELQGTRALEQLRDRATSAHVGATSAVSHGKAVLSDAESILASLEGMRKVLRHRKGQAALSRRMALVRDRTMVEAQRKTKQAEKMLGNSLSISTTARKTAREAEQVAVESAERAQAVLQESKQTRKQAGELATRANETWQELSRQEHVAGKLRGDLEEADQVRTEANQMSKSLQEARGSLLADIETLNDLLSSLGPVEQAARRQREKIQAFESDLAEIRADKQNLEAILQSLPEGCASWR
ncbi:PREDICTED: laminin subunit gamma-3-like [Tinamus guttatus]|uniref:laminin subunit gamma-3-like n=1 Tax=Tinamus guttatus TaxID=94827 RepID=UPI00052F0590|nr:PREDICTED: laminin subunit gamma-3-like [Tinamus guttatus]